MPIKKTSYFVVLLSCMALSAQPNPSSQEAQRREWIDQYRLRQLEDWQGRDSRQADELAKRREARIREWRFLNLVQRFTDRWRELTEEYKARGAVNPKKFKAVSRAFRELEKSDGWLSPK
jgi:hypothetical protein